MPYFSVPEDPDPAVRPRRRVGRRPSARTSSTARAASHRLHDPLPGVLHRRRGRAPAPGSSSCCTPSPGRGREYRFAWDEEGNQLDRDASWRRCPPPSPPSVSSPPPARPCSASPTPARVQRTAPVTRRRASTRDVPPVVWRTGPALHRAASAGRRRARAAARRTLLRSIALQALQHGDVLIVDGGGTRRVRLPDRPRRRAGRRVRAGRGAGQPGVGGARDGAAADRREPGPAGRPARARRHPAAAVDPPGPADACSAIWRRPKGAAIRRRCSRCRCGTAGRPT